MVEVPAPPPADARAAIDCELITAPIDAGAMLASARPADGAVATFVGVVRNHNGGRQVRYLEYEAHERMATRVLERLAAQAQDQFGVGPITILHRLGRLEIGEISVAVVVASAHRAEALKACGWLIDTLKVEAPIFKKEHYSDGEAWVE